jgi:hypothetical protein
MHTDLQIHKTGVELLSLAADVQAVLPRSFRHYGDRIGDECTELLVAIAHANAAKGERRAAHVAIALERVDVVAVMLRVAFGKRLISQKLWARAAELTGSIGRQGGGWLKASLNVNRNAAPAA